MNYGIVLRVLGIILIIEAALMVPSYIIALYSNGHDSMSFLITILITALVGFLMTRKKNTSKVLTSREGFTIVTFGWILVSVFGSLPLYLSGSVETFIDSLFEIVSGFTTTGSTIMTDVEVLPLGILYWRSFTHWIGGMGILVFTLALLPALGIGGFQIFKAESPGPMAGKIAPRLKDTARTLYITYILLTIANIILLMVGGMNLFDALIFSYGTMGTGGFANKNLSVGSYQSSYIHFILGIFMIIAGTNFSLYYSLSKKRFAEFYKDEELRLYLIVIAVAVLAITINLMFSNYDNLFKAFRDAFFQVSSIITTTGFTTVDYDLWPSFSKLILLFLMFIGGCAGSTAGGMKIIRVLIMLKLIKREVTKSLHPRAMLPIKVNGKVVSNEFVAGINSFISLYLLIFVVSSIIVTTSGVSITSAMSSVAATLGNIGPALEFAGPTRNFVAYSQPLKLLFTMLMLLGRLELFTVITLFSPKTWRKE